MQKREKVINKMLDKMKPYCLHLGGSKIVLINNPENFKLY
jgi:hypothetical protein